MSEKPTNREIELAGISQLEKSIAGCRHPPTKNMLVEIYNNWIRQYWEKYCPMARYK